MSMVDFDDVAFETFADEGFSELLVRDRLTGLWRRFVVSDIEVGAVDALAAAALEDILDEEPATLH